MGWGRSWRSCGQAGTEPELAPLSPPTGAPFNLSAVPVSCARPDAGRLRIHITEHVRAGAEGDLSGCAVRSSIVAPALARGAVGPAACAVGRHFPARALVPQFRGGIVPYSRSFPSVGVLGPQPYPVLSLQRPSWVLGDLRWGLLGKSGGGAARPGLAWGHLCPVFVLQAQSGAHSPMLVFNRH